MTQPCKCQLTAASLLYTGSDQPGPVSSRHSWASERLIGAYLSFMAIWGFWGSESLIIVVILAHGVLLDNSKSLFTQTGLVKLSDSQNSKKKKKNT